MPTTPRFHTGLIVVTLWENVLAHQTTEDFKTATRAAILAAGNLSLLSRHNHPLPNLIIARDNPLRRLASWVVKLDKPENANTLTKRVLEKWIGLDQGGRNRGLDIGDGYRPRLNCAALTNVRDPVVYERAFEVLACRYARSRVEPPLTKLPDDGEKQAEAIVKYLSNKMGAAST